MTDISGWMIRFAESGVMPDSLVRVGIRRLIDQRLKQITHADGSSRVDMDSFVAMMSRSNIANVSYLANQQHYEIPAAFFEYILGTHNNYSCCYWDEKSTTLDDAESAALEQCSRFAQIEDGMQILDLGCGWGPHTLWLARRYPNATITAVSNAPSQCLFIEEQAQREGLNNISTIVADMNIFHTDKRYDRVISIEMFEHLHNYEAMFERISGWLEPDGLFYMRVFCHHNSAYEFFDSRSSDWLSRHFFTGGLMPSKDLPYRFQKDLSVIESAYWDGTHYSATAKAWLENMDQHRTSIVPILDSVYGSEESYLWWIRWRIFFMSIDELFAYQHGKEWQIGQFLLSKQQPTRSEP